MEEGRRRTLEPWGFLMGREEERLLWFGDSSPTMVRSRRQVARRPGQDAWLAVPNCGQIPKQDHIIFVGQWENVKGEGCAVPGKRG